MDAELPPTRLDPTQPGAESLARRWNSRVGPAFSSLDSPARFRSIAATSASGGPRPRPHHLDRPHGPAVTFFLVPESPSMKNKPVVTRRHFLETTGAVTGAAMAAGAFPHPAVAGVKGANER